MIYCHNDRLHRHIYIYIYDNSRLSAITEGTASGVLKGVMRFRVWHASGFEHSGNGSGVMDWALFPMRCHASTIIPHRHFLNSCHLLSHLVLTSMVLNETITTPAVNTT